MIKEQLKEKLLSRLYQDTPIAGTNLGKEFLDVISSVISSTIDATWNSAIDEALKVVGEDLENVEEGVSVVVEPAKAYQQIANQGKNLERLRVIIALTELKK